MSIFHIYKLFNRVAFIAASEGVWIHFYGFVSWNAITVISYGETKRYTRRQGIILEPFIAITIDNPSQNIKPLTINDRGRAAIFPFPSQIKLVHLSNDPKSLLPLLGSMRKKHRQLVDVPVETCTLRDTVLLIDVQTKIMIILLLMLILGIVLNHGNSISST